MQKQKRFWVAKFFTILVGKGKIMTKFFEWLGRNRKPIGCFIGGLTMLAAISNAAKGDIGLAALWFAIGFMIIWDSYEAK